MPDEKPMIQSRRSEAYQQALNQLALLGLTYPCGCTRRDIEQALPRAAQPASATPSASTPAPAATGCTASRRARCGCCTGSATARGTAIEWHDRRLGAQTQDVAREVGDFVLQRADGLWAYQLAVVVDDAAQGVTDVVRGEDLADNTAAADPPAAPARPADAALPAHAAGAAAPTARSSPSRTARSALDGQRPAGRVAAARHRCSKLPAHRTPAASANGSRRRWRAPLGRAAGWHDGRTLCLASCPTREPSP